MEFEAKTPTAREADETFDRSLIAALVAIFILRTASGAMPRIAATSSRSM